jgi:sugar phosphate isomerase/epimerase
MSQFVLSAFADEIDMNLTTQMDVLDQHGIKHIEMRGVNGKGLVEYSLDEVKEIKKQIDARGFKLSSVGSPLGKIKITDEFGPHLDLFKHTLEIAHIMEAPYIRMFSFFIPRGEDPAKYREEVMKRWQAFIETARGSGLILLHENEKEIYGDTAERCLDLIETMSSSYFRAIFDPANFIQCQVETYPYAFGVLKDHVVYMHIKDALYRSGEVVPAGEGDGKVREILQELHRGGFEGFLSLEPHLGSFQGLEKLEIDSKIKKMEDGGPKTFAVAVNALKRILEQIGAT